MQGWTSAGEEEEEEVELKLGPLVLEPARPAAASSDGDEHALVALAIMKRVDECAGSTASSVPAEEVKTERRGTRGRQLGLLRLQSLLLLRRLLLASLSQFRIQKGTVAAVWRWHARKSRVPRSVGAKGDGQAAAATVSNKRGGRAAAAHTR